MSEVAHAVDRSAPAPDERRTTPRVGVRVDVSLYSESQFFAGVSEDLGEGGVFVATYAPLPIGTEIDLVFTLPTNHEIRTSGVVRWVRSVDCETVPGFGVQFGRLAVLDIDAIRTFLRHRPPLVWDDAPLE